jgi:S-formylglutathione hydrolase FrmB
MSITHGWIPLSVQVLATATVLLAIGRRSRRWVLVSIPLALLAGAALAAAVHSYIVDQGLADDPAPLVLWLWIAATGVAAAIVALGWRGSAWWRRAVSVFAVPLCVSCAALTLNAWVGYLPTTSAAWDRVTGAPLPGQTDHDTAVELQQQGTAPNWNAIVKVTIPAASSGFEHRDELVILPPAWYASTPPPRLPVVMMIGGEFGQPSDWIYAGGAQQTINEFAAVHGGNAPVLVFPDSSGAFSNDTECVNGIRGNAADHLTKDVVPYLIANFGVSADPANWGVVGWSSGGTCALTLAVTHPELFAAFVDIDGQRGPNAGTKAQTIARLFGGDADAWSAFDPLTVVAKHGPYQGMSAWFSVSTDTPNVYRAPTDTEPAPPTDPAGTLPSDDHAAIASQLCQMLSGYGIECAVVADPGGHDFASAASAFAASLPWLAGRLGTTGVPKIGLPGAKN